MKNWFNSIVIGLSLVVAYGVYYGILGMSSNFKNGDQSQPINAMGTVFTGGFLVGLLLACIIISITFIIERWLSINKARGKGETSGFIKRSVELLAKGNVD